uniref:Uncharacterized protein n=1 Tax=Myoviridae sp. ctfOA1 TaxID=2825148 RepID=A0A8S5P5W4_9CAUD|nr:MAG TPA: hypothetical protein [Myoviridae sp. ctfOA1]
MLFPATVITGSVCRYHPPLLPTPDNASALLARAWIMKLAVNLITQASL